MQRFGDLCSSVVLWWDQQCLTALSFDGQPHLEQRRLACMTYAVSAHLKSTAYERADDSHLDMMSKQDGVDDDVCRLRPHWLSPLIGSHAWTFCCCHVLHHRTSIAGACGSSLLQRSSPALSPYRPYPNHPLSRHPPQPVPHISMPRCRHRPPLPTATPAADHSHTAQPATYLQAATAAGSSAIASTERSTFTLCTVWRPTRSPPPSPSCPNLAIRSAKATTVLTPSSTSTTTIS